MTAARVLLVEDNRADARLLRELLAEVPGQPFVLSTAESLAEAAPRGPDHDVVLLDLSLPDAHGVGTVKTMVAAARHTPIVVLTGTDDERTAIEAVQAGAQDYLLKAELSPSVLARTIRYAIERKKAEENARRLVALELAQAQSEEAVRRAHFLAEVTTVTSSSLDLDQTLARLARLLVPPLGDVCYLALVERDGLPQRVARADRLAPGASPDDAPHHLVLDAVNQRRTILVSAPEEAPPTQGAWMITPAIGRQGTVGVLSYLKAGPSRAFSQDERLLAEDIAWRVALAIDNAQLYRQAQRAIRARDELLAIVSHDLRTPMSVLSLVLTAIDTAPDGRRADMLARAQRALERMERLIKDLLDVARIDAGTLKVDPKPVPLAVILDDALEHHRPIATEKRISLTLEAPHAPDHVLADRDRIAQVLANLLGNALKFTPPSGCVRVSTERGEAHVVIAVADTGPGIHPDNLPHVFDRFWQASQRSNGVGLGLAIAKGIVEAHGGLITASSTPGQGATLRVTLPLAGDDP